MLFVYLMKDTQKITILIKFVQDIATDDDYNSYASYKNSCLAFRILLLKRRLLVAQVP